MSSVGPALTLEQVPCALCGTDRADPVLVTRQRVAGLQGGFMLVRCRACGLVFVNPRPAAADLSAYYPDRYAAHAAVTLTSQRRLAELWHRYVRLFVRDVDVLRDRAPGRLLDVGTGTGNYLRLMAQRGWDTVGVEVDPDAAAAARASGLVVHTGELRNQAFAADSFDAVTFRRSFEHIHDPLETLREAYRVCLPGGTIFLEVPNFSSVERRLFGKWWTPIDAPRHLYHFTPTTLAAMLDRVGFSTERVDQQVCYRSAVDSAAERIGIQLGGLLASHAVYGAVLPLVSLLTRLTGHGSLMRARATKPSEHGVMAHPPT